MTPSRFRANVPRVVDETVDGETLIIDMVSGNYFSCVGASAAAWLALSGGATPVHTAELLSAAYGIPADDAEADVERFVAALVNEELVVARHGDAEEAPDRAVTEALVGAYQPLAVQKYTDLSDLLLLDPVHDVAPGGWPEQAD